MQKSKGNDMEVTCDGQPLLLETATPYQVRLALIEGGLQFAREAQTCWEQGQPAIAAQKMSRCRRILSELLRGTQPDQAPLSRQISSLYLYLFRQLVDSQLQRDLPKLQEIIRVLELEQQTWQDVCRGRAAA